MIPDIQPQAPASQPRFVMVAELVPNTVTPELSYPQWVDRYALAVMEAEGYPPSALTRESEQHAA